MATFKLIALVLVVALTAMLVQPARAEAIEPTVVIALAGAAVVVLIIVVYLVVANVRERQPGQAAMPVVLAYDAGGVQGQ